MEKSEACIEVFYLIITYRSGALLVGDNARGKQHALIC